MRYAIRSLLKNWVSTLLTVVSLATGMGAVTLVFSIVDSVLLRPLPYQDSDRLVFVWSVPPNTPNAKRAATVETYLALRKEGTVFDHVGTIRGVGETATLGAEPGQSADQVERQRISADIPPALGATPLMGRWFTEAEAQDGTKSVIVISHRLWQQRYAGAPGIIGRTLHLDGELTTIIGVMPDGWMLFNYPAQFWAPYRVSVGDRNERIVPVARLRAGVGLRQAQAEMDQLASNLAKAFPATNQGWSIRLEPAIDVYVGWIRQPLLIAQGVALLVLLIGCANAVGILLVRATARNREISVRVALGGGPWRIARDLFFESVLLSLCGILAGLLISHVGLRLFLLISPAWFPRAGEIALHGRALAAAGGLSAFSALAFGTIPAWQATRANLLPGIREASRQASEGLRTQKLRAALVVLQVSAALTLLTGAAMMINSFTRLFNSSVGCDTSNLTTFQVRFAASPVIAKQPSVNAGRSGVFLSSERPSVAERMRERISAVLGVEAVAYGQYPPFSDSTPGAVEFRIDGRSAGSSASPSAIWLAVSTAYFNTLRVPLLRGREFRLDDTAASSAVAVVNEAIARRFWPTESPLGKRIALAGANEPLREIVGVVGNLRLDRRAHEAEMQIYIPDTQIQPVGTRSEVPARGSWTFVMRAANNAGGIIPVVRAIAAEEARGLPIFNIKSVDNYIDEQLWQPRQTMMLLSVFGVTALVLALCGVFGIVSYMVRQRNREIGIRIALGATQRDVLRLVLSYGFSLVVLGTGCGILGSLFLARVLGSLLWGVTGTDMVTYASAITVLIATSVLAGYLPAREAASVDPAAALRSE